jgi:hypothetical protein
VGVVCGFGSVAVLWCFVEDCRWIGGLFCRLCTDAKMLRFAGKDASFSVAEAHEKFGNAVTIDLGAAGVQGASLEVCSFC